MPLFDGHGFDGWKGLVADPPARAKMTPQELAKAQAEADERMRAHWKVVDGVARLRRQGRKPLHRLRLRRFRAPRRLEDREGRRQRPLSPGIAAGPDLGPRRQPGRLGRPLQQSKGKERPPGKGRPPRRRVELLPRHHDRRPRQRLSQRQARRRQHHPRELLGDGTSRSTRTGQIELQAHGNPSLFPEYLHPRDPARHGRAADDRGGGGRRVHAPFQRPRSRRLDGRHQGLRRRGRQDRHPPRARQRQSLHGQGIRRLRPPLRVQADARRQQRPRRPGAPRRRRRLRRHGDPDPRGRLTRLLGPPAVPIPRLDLRGRRRRAAAFSARRASGTPKKSRSRAGASRSSSTARPSSTPTSTRPRPAARSTATSIRASSGSPATSASWDTARSSSSAI